MLFVAVPPCLWVIVVAARGCDLLVPHLLWRKWSQCSDAKGLTGVLALALLLFSFVCPRTAHSKSLHGKVQTDARHVLHRFDREIKQITQHTDTLCTQCSEACVLVHVRACDVIKLELRC